ncbi:hypothetical protein [Nodularia sp. NIES-3585]|uniref:hypothetical protein n=1 Tax=Nodularia sp. NIES-3585 TaxID=1973477 RepID=UPI000B5CA057|nr:hypothetical protein [Nodularia sp. NIES-3585]GAX37892.1 hypothetical protein NIES3585_39370 [Nodularia sp. NIES-3585]
MNIVFIQVPSSRSLTEGEITLSLETGLLALTLMSFCGLAIVSLKIFSRMNQLESCLSIVKKQVDDCLRDYANSKAISMHVNQINEIGDHRMERIKPAIIFPTNEQ